MIGSLTETYGDDSEKGESGNKLFKKGKGYN